MPLFSLLRARAQVSEGLLKGAYESVHAATRDVRMVWANALLYWKKGSRAARSNEQVAGLAARLRA